MNIVPTMDGQTLTFNLDEYAGAEEEVAVEITFDAAIKEDADLSGYAGSTVPNTASYKFTDAEGKEYTLDSNDVTVTPPDEPEPGPEPQPEPTPDPTPEPEPAPAPDKPEKTTTTPETIKKSTPATDDPLSPVPLLVVAFFAVGGIALSKKFMFRVR